MEITRRDFVNGVLVGAGSALLTATPPRPAAAAVSPDLFTGYGGVGDYAKANGNTWPVVQAAHRIRDGIYDTAALSAAEPAGRFDLVVVGGGLSGLATGGHLNGCTVSSTIAAIGSIFASILSRDWACTAFDALARKRSTKACKCARRSSCFLSALPARISC